MNIATTLEYAARNFPDRPAVIEGERELSYLEFNRAANRVASALSGLGVRPGDHVALCAPNSLQYLAFYYGVLKAGAVAVTLSHSLSVSEFRSLLADAAPGVIFAPEERRNHLEDPHARNSGARFISPGDGPGFRALFDAGAAEFRALDRERRDTAAILYTGGTTGISKGVLLSHENLMTSAYNVSHFERSTPHDRALCFLPLNHVFGQVHITLATVASAGCLVLQPAFDPEQSTRLVERKQITKFFAVPTIYLKLLSLKNLQQRFRSIRYCFSAASSMPVEMLREWRQRLHLAIHESYGMTETAAMVTYNHYDRHVAGSVGTAVNTVEVQLRDEAGHILAQGEKGEICIRGPNVMQGYLNKPQETRNAFWGDWFRSGDIGVLDGEGYLFIVDRLKDMIITGGENVYPREIEELLCERPEVRECAVVGLPDPLWGERVTAFVVPKEGRELGPETLKSFLKSRISPFKVPKEFIPVAELPKSAAGKILKREIRRTYADK